MRIGVTRAKGFIGRHLILALKKKGPVVILPRRKGLPGKQELKRFVTGTDLIFHLGGVNRGTNEEILNGNIIGTSRLLESILNYGKSSTRLFTMFPEFMKNKVSAIVVNWKGKDVLSGCLQSLSKHDYENLEIWVSDNGFRMVR